MPVDIKRVLFPTDFSDLSLHALSYARELVSLFDAQLFSIHVIDEAYQYWSAMGPESVPIGPGVEDLTAMAEAQMQRFADEHLVGLSCAPVTHITTGRPFAEIIRYARENTIDLIVFVGHPRARRAGPRVVGEHRGEDRAKGPVSRADRALRPARLCNALTTRDRDGVSDP